MEETKNVEYAHKKVVEDFGKELPYRIVDNAPTAYFDWERITIPRRFLEWDIKMLTNVIRHEFGHLFFSPRDPDTGIIIAHIGSVMRYPEPWLLTNIITDLIVDMTNLEIFGKEYLEFLEWSIGNVRDRMEIIGIMAGVYREKAISLGLQTNLVENDVGKTVYRILTDDTKSFFKRVVEVAKILSPYRMELRPKHFIIYIYGNADDPLNVARAFMKKGIDPEEAIRIVGAGGIFMVIDDPVIIEYRRMRVISKYMELENDMGKKVRRERTVWPWSIGDPPQELDVVRTISNYGIVLPGVYSLKSAPVVSGMELGGKRYRDCVIIVDASGSMEGKKFERVREAAYVIVKNTYDDGGKVGFIPFSGDVWEDYVVYPTRDYLQVVDILLRIMPTGGTNMLSALHKAMDMGKNYYIYIFSDSEVYDINRTRQILENFRGRTTFFLISDSPNVDRWFDMDGIKVVEISPEGLVKRAYREVRS